MHIILYVLEVDWAEPMTEDVSFQGESLWGRFLRFLGIFLERWSSSG